MLGGGGPTFLKEEVDLVVRIDEVVVSRVLGLVAAVLTARFELGHGVAVQRELWAG